VRVDLDEAKDALAQAGGRPPRDFRVVLARHTDLWRVTLGVPLRPADAVLPAGALDGAGRGLLDLLVGAAEGSASLRDAALAIVHAADAPASQTAGQVFTRVCAQVQPWLPPERVRAEPVRGEELLRRWANDHGVRVVIRGRAQPVAQAARALKRLDFRGVAAQERALDREKALLEARRVALERIAAGGAL
jgi:hypothetical protein